MGKILLYSKDLAIKALLKRYLLFDQYEIFEKTPKDGAVIDCGNSDIDLIVADLGSSCHDVLDFLAPLKIHESTPIIILHNKDEKMALNKGFDIGIDDYIEKPFTSKELLHKVSAILGRAPSHSMLNEEGHVVYQKAGLFVDLTAHKVTVDGKTLTMAPKEYDLLFFLVRNKNIAIPHEKLLSEVWGYDYFGDDRTLYTHIKLLRKSLGPYKKHITTIRGLGYRFDD